VAAINVDLKITEPWTHHVKVAMTFEVPENQNEFEVFMPVWSPGSYMVREYSRHVRRLRVVQKNGEFLFFEKKNKNTWLIDRSKSELKNLTTEVSVEYEVYCNEITVRTSHVNQTHAFIHGPSVFMGIKGYEDKLHHLKVEFPPIWTKLTTSLKDISPKREVFLYEADNYDRLLDCPLEIGCHETNGFRVEGKDHHLAFLNLPQKIHGDLRNDIKVITQKVADFWGEIPYEQYVYMGHFFPKVYGGLEHCDSTALQFDPFELGQEEGYFDFLGLVSHEYFHTWNVKRVRPVELGPFDYSGENYTKMHWLTEGFTSFMDDLLVFNCKLSNEDFFLKRLVKKINAYNKTPGRLFDSVEDASFDAWIKLYRPHENSKNSTINYYLKGALIFFCLNSMLSAEGANLQDFARLLWKRYKENPAEGMSKEEVLEILEKISGEDIRNDFERLLVNTGELPLVESCEKAGLKVHFKQSEDHYWGCDFKNQNGSQVVQNIVLDGPAHKCGLNHGDEIIGAEGWRLTGESFNSFCKTLKKSAPVEFLIARQGRLLTIEVAPEKAPQEIEKLEIKDRALFEKTLLQY
jgi:predicted metalloprotease with PDZ domain